MVGTLLFIFVCVGTIALLVERRWITRLHSWDTYLIKRDRHYSTPDNWLLRLLPFKITLAPKTLRFTAIFGQGTDLPSSEDDINKLYGMTFGLDPEYRSIRVGWRASSLGFIELFAYWYENGKRGFRYLGRTQINQEVKFVIWHDGRQSCWVSMRPAGQGDGTGLDTTIEVSMSGVSNWLRFRLYPFFGGNIKAPCDMKIFICNE